MKRFLVALALLVAAPAAAGTLTLSPAVVTLKGAPGQGVTQTLRLHNGTEHMLAFDLTAMDVVVRDGKRVFVPAGELPASIAATAVFSRKSVVIPPGADRAVDLTVTLTPGAEHRAIVALYKGTTQIATQRAPATVSLGTLLTFNVGDDVSVEASPLSVSPQSASSNAVFELALENDGAEPVVPRGVAAILDAGGKLIAKSPFESRRLLPGERLTVHAEHAGELQPGTYRVVATFEHGGKSLVRTAALVQR
jgi:hypothetical protein